MRRYHCGNCGCKRDAARFSRIETLPPVRPSTRSLGCVNWHSLSLRITQVLHFSLLRFVFNIEELTRSKSQNSISYPLKIDMGQFLPPDAQGARPQVWYDLKGVLMHKGKSAHHGHYVAQVQDAT